MAKRQWWQKRWFCELIYNGPPIIAAVIMVSRTLAEQNRDMVQVALGVTAVVWLFIVWILRVRMAAKEDAKDEPDVVHEGLYAAVSTLHAMLSYYCGQRGCAAEIRSTFHRVVPPLDRPTAIEQIVPYVGSNDGGSGRGFSINTGITGQAIRRKTAIILSSVSQSEEEHRGELVANWGYTDAQAKALTSGRYSAAAVPVLDATGQHALGVIYLDSNERGVFDRKEVQQILGVGCTAISDFVTKRY